MSHTRFWGRLSALSRSLAMFSEPYSEVPSSERDNNGDNNNDI